MKAGSQLRLGTKLWIAHLFVEPVSWRPAPGAAPPPRQVVLAQVSPPGLSRSSLPHDGHHPQWDVGHLECTSLHGRVLYVQNTLACEGSVQTSKCETPHK